MPITVIIGNGIAGISTAIRLRELTDGEIIIISSESTFFFSRTALMYIYMGQLRLEDTKPYEDSFWKQHNLELVFDHVISIDTDLKQAKLKSNKSLKFDYLVIASGSKPRSGEWKGSNLSGVQSLYSLQDLEIMETKTNNIKNAVVAGGGLIGIEMCEMLNNRGIKVDFLIREPHFMSNILSEEESLLVEEHILDHGIRLHTNTEINSFRGDQKGNLRSVETNNHKNIECSFAGITIGVQPNLDFLKDSKIEISKGILADQYLQTNIQGIYTAGDCTELRSADMGRKTIEPVWYTGKLMGAVVAQNIASHPIKYTPGYWFNSAKFFDLEYQVYGWIPSKNAENHSDFFWKDTTKLRSIRIHYETTSHHVTGFNFIGVRARQKECESAIRNKMKFEHFINNIDEVIFDTEFTKPLKYSIISYYNNLVLITN